MLGVSETLFVRKQIINGEVFVAVISSYLFLFAVGAVWGWLIELFFRRIFTAKKWINPGFLHGPYLPIYGFGACLMYAVSEVDLNISESPALNLLIRFLVSAFLLTAIEYIGGLIFIRLMKIRLWDYSKRKGNIQGIICPLFSFLWGAAGLFFYLVLYDPFKRSVNWFEGNVVALFFLGVFYGIIAVDLGVSLHLATALRKALKDSDLVAHYELMKLAIMIRKEELRQKYNFLVPFSRSDIVAYTEKLKEGGFDDLKERITRLRERRKAEKAAKENEKK